jgi:hypothetical protein
MGQDLHTPLWTLARESHPIRKWVPWTGKARCPNSNTQLSLRTKPGWFRRFGCLTQVE